MSRYIPETMALEMSVKIQHWINSRPAWQFLHLYWFISLNRFNNQTSRNVSSMKQIQILLFFTNILFIHESLELPCLCKACSDHTHLPFSSSVAPFCPAHWLTGNLTPSLYFVKLIDIRCSVINVVNIFMCMGLFTGVPTWVPYKWRPIARRSWSCNGFRTPCSTYAAILTGFIFCG